MAGRPKHYQEEELIDRAEKVFWQKGYNATKATHLLKAMNIGQGSFYLTFKGGKKELYKKSLVRFSEKAGRQYKNKLSQTDNPIEFISAFFYSLVTRSKEQAMNGCYLGNALVEFSNVDEETRKLSGELLSKLEKNFEDTLILAQKQGKLSKEKSPSILAKYLINLWNGVNITLRMNPNDEYVETIIKMNLQILD